LTSDKLSHGLANYNKKRGVMKTGTHRYRHTFAKNWILNNGSVFKLQKILGHSSLDVVKNYVNMFTNNLQKDFNDYSPLESLRDSKVHIRMNK
jgi:integrase/recombinase XerD